MIIMLLPLGVWKWSFNCKNTKKRIKCDPFFMGCIKRTKLFIGTQ